MDEAVHGELAHFVPRSPAYHEHPATLFLIHHLARDGFEAHPQGLDGALDVPLACPAYRLVHPGALPPMLAKKTVGLPTIVALRMKRVGF
jgi:hypothetical protein